ncbi:hypothetical protein LCGC14_3078520, partial [marine sediment metagenome]
MQVTIGEKGLTKSWQEDFPKTTECCLCKGESRIGFVAHEGFSDDDKTDDDKKQRVHYLHPN